MHHPVQIRVGVPQTTGQLVRFAARKRLPVLFSANAFARSGPDGDFVGFNLHHASNLPPRLDAALDSSGFVAAVRYGDYRWTVEDYLELVAARRWSWWASMDYCCEPPVASAAVVRDLRIEATVQNYDRCANLAARRGLPAPMPVLQGWRPEHYERCARLYAFRQWPALVGLGSVCRRGVHGPDGLLAIVDALDEFLPAHVKLHAFGCKGAGLKSLGHHPRLHSIDSQAWDFAVRATCRTGRTQQMRANAMFDWFKKQHALQPLERASASLPVQRDLTPTSLEERVHAIVADWYASNLLGEHDYRETVWLAQEQAELILVRLRLHGPSTLLDSGDAVDLDVHEKVYAAA